jgi:hypothetical protein
MASTLVRPWRAGRPVPRVGYRRRVPLILHWGGPRHREVDDVPAEQLASSLLVYDGPRWFGVYQRADPVQHRPTPQGSAEVWLARE